MIRNRLILKTIAVLIILEMITSVLAEPIAYALTSGPTAPEATSFEPVDTTNLVNLSSGDLAYNVPILEVPGPSGGYPLSLSYHAGIQPNEDASWVGLGWTLNPGSIFRNVSGIADDYRDVANSTRFYWDGGRSESFSIGVTVGVAGEASATAGLSYSHDTFLGSGVGMSIGFESAAGITGSIGVSPYGDPFASVGTSASLEITEGLELEAENNLTTDFKSVDFEAKRGLTVSGLMEASIAVGSSEGTASSVGLKFLEITQNSRAGKISEKESGFNVKIPLGALSVSLGYKYRRYWIDQTDYIFMNGALINSPANASSGYFDQHAFDNYSLMDEDSALVDNLDAEKLLGGSYPNYDEFYVQAQGVGGSIRPYYFQKHLVKRNNFSINSDDEKEYQTIQYPLGNNSQRAEFRFVGDFSNRFEYTPVDTKMVPDAGHTYATPLTFDFAWSTELKKGESGTEAYTSNILPGSRHIDYLTTSDIVNTRGTDVGFLETTSTGFVRLNQPPDGIGAIIITNETGVRYHFALPVLNFDEYSYAENISKVLTFNETKNPYPYAYSWLLTAVTGPDYVDRGPNGTADGKLNDYDWGYWVSFEYGKWTDQYYWRNPSEATTLDIDNQFRKFSEGRKELYYLDAIRTKSHTALFVKDIRDDAKSTIYSYRNISNKTILTSKEDITTETKYGGFIPRQITNKCDRGTSLFGEDHGTITYYTRPTSSLKLNKILLFKNEQLGTVDKSNGLPYKQQFSYPWSIQSNSDIQYTSEECNFTDIQFNHHLYQNVLDVYDVQTYGSSFLNNALRVVDFETDYSLCPGTANSFNWSIANVNTPSTNSASYPLNGKLTLKKIHLLGKAGANLIPPTVFNYESERRLKGSGTLTQSGSTYYLSQSNSGLNVGDIIKIFGTSQVSYALVESSSSYTNVIKPVGIVSLTTGSVNWQVTKNPPYDKDAYDIWGLYKSDINRFQLATNENAARLVTQQSAMGLDCWSLKSVKSPLGADITFDYEPDSYKKPVLALSQLLRIQSIQKKTGTSNYLVTLYDDIKDLDKMLKSGDAVSYTVLMAFPFDIEPVSLKSFRSEVRKGEFPVLNLSYNGTKWIIETSDISNIFANPDSQPYKASLLIGGSLDHHHDVQNFGGGIRVKAVHLKSMNATHITNYDYNVQGSTSGVTSFEPGALDQGLLTFPAAGQSNGEYFTNAKLVEKARKDFDRELHANFMKVLANSREITPPGVLYEYVTVTNSIARNDGTTEVQPESTVFNFEVFNAGLVGAVYDRYKEYEFPQPVSPGQGPFDKIRSREVIFKNYTARVGALKTVTLYHGNAKVTETVNHYLHDGVPANLASNISSYESRVRQQFNGQGIIQETFSEAHFAKQDYEIQVNVGPTNISMPAFNLLAVVSKREEYPVIQTGQTTINYKTGIVSESWNTAFDFYSGKVTNTITKDGHGNSYLAVTTPAYRVYPAMQPRGAGGKNMLTQTAATALYKIDPSTNQKLGVASASVQTWSDQLAVLGAPGAKQPGIWRKDATYGYKGDDVPLNPDGLYPYGNFANQAFNFQNPSASSSQWQKTSAITLYDVNTNAVEATDISGAYGATLIASNGAQVIATVANANHDEFTYSGFENINDGNLAFEGTYTQVATAHSGQYGLQLTNGVVKFNTNVARLAPNTNYTISYWVSGSGHQTTTPYYRLNGGARVNIPNNESSLKKIVLPSGTWYLHTTTFSFPSGTTALEIGCQGSNVAVDDFRFHPYNAAMLSYVYNQWGEVNFIINNNNLATEYTYDAMGRLVQVRSESFQSGGRVRKSETTYHNLSIN